MNDTYDNLQFLRLAASHGTVELVSKDVNANRWRLIATYQNETRPIELGDSETCGNPSICMIIQSAENRRSGR